MSLSLDKNSIRTTLLQRRMLLSCTEIASGSAAAQTNLLSLPAFQQAKTIALYSPTRNEVETDRLLSAALAMDKRVCFPSVFEDELRFFQVWSLADLNVGRFGIHEPIHQSTEVDPGQIGLLLVPGVAFDRHGHRIGYGRGYFDRLLSGSCFDGLSVGFGYDFQIQDKLPAEEHDQKVALLVSDKDIYSPL